MKTLLPSLASRRTISFPFEKSPKIIFSI
jgi:hypothetical protein